MSCLKTEKSILQVYFALPYLHGAKHSVKRISAGKHLTCPNNSASVRIVFRSAFVILFPLEHCWSSGQFLCWTVHWQSGLRLVHCWEMGLAQVHVVQSRVTLVQTSEASRHTHREQHSLSTTNFRPNSHSVGSRSGWQTSEQPYTPLSHWQVVWQLGRHVAPSA